MVGFFPLVPLYATAGPDWVSQRGKEEEEESGEWTRIRTNRLYFVFSK